MRRLRLTPTIVLGLLLLAGCSRDKAETLRGTQVRSWLRSVSSDSVVTLASGDTLHISPATVDFYKRRRWHAAWAGPEELLERGWSVYQAVGRSHEDGLPREKYAFNTAQKLIQKLEAEGEAALPDSTRDSYLASLDVVLTEGFNRYSNDLVSGSLDPETSGIDWRIPRGKAREERVLQNVINGMPVTQVVATLRPSIPNYERTRSALAQYYEAARRGGWPKVPEGVALKKGVRHNAVSVLRTRLIAGLDASEAALAQKGAADPTLYDAELVKAVAHFQQRHGIEPDGAVGEGTLRELNHTVEERIEEIKLNLDRWRWLPDALGERYVMVNIAGFELEVVDKGRVIEAMNVVVGQRSWQTPVFADTMENLVANPYWNVPPSIYEQEIAPAIARDPTYLARHNYERTSDGGVRQRPGPGNALGKYKFVFPNKDDIYLHDTPADHLFSRTRRDFSHGCIRLERPEDLARLVVKMQTSKSWDEVKRAADNGGERWIKLERPLPVYILYFTTWVEEDGTVRFHHDVYGRDEQMREQAKDKLTRVAAR